MQVSIDRAGRIVVPKPVREELGLSPGSALELDVVEGRLELSVAHDAPKVIDGPNGPLVAATGTPITDDEVRRVLEAARERR